MQGIPINHKRARIRQALLLSLIDRYTYIHIDRRFTEGKKTGGLFVSTSFKIQQRQTTHMKDNRLACAFKYI